MDGNEIAVFIKRGKSRAVLHSSSTVCGMQIPLIVQWEAWAWACVKDRSRESEVVSDPRTLPPHSNPVCCVVNRIQDALATLLGDQSKAKGVSTSPTSQNCIRNHNKLNQNKNTSQSTIDSVARKPLTSTTSRNSFNNFS